MNRELTKRVHFAHKAAIRLTTFDAAILAELMSFTGDIDKRQRRTVLTFELAIGGNRIDAASHDYEHLEG